VNEEKDTSYRQDIEQAVKSILRAPVPDETFVERLGARISRSVMGAGRSGATSNSARALVKALLRSRWATSLTAGLLLLMIALAVIGSIDVWAQVQLALGYVPGVGFVDMDQAKVLTAPLDVSRGNVSLQIEQVVAQRDRTVVVMRIAGLPPESELWPARSISESVYRPRIRLADGTALAIRKWSASWGRARLEFPALPEGTYRFQLELPRLPLVPPNQAPEDWVIPLRLGLATGELVEEMFPRPYAPSRAYATVAGITVEVTDVAHTVDETALRIRVDPQNNDWRPVALAADSFLELRDEFGSSYRWQEFAGSATSPSIEIEKLEIDSSAQSATPSWDRGDVFTETFDPLSPSAIELTLRIDAIQFLVPVEGEFILDLGDSPEIGDHWPLDISFDAASVPVKITGVTLKEDITHFPGKDVRFLLLVFAIEPASTDSGRSLRGLTLEATPHSSARAGGYAIGPIKEMSSILGWETLPAGPIEVRALEAVIAVEGPWIVSWQVP